MKLLLLVCLLGIASADLIQQASPAVDDAVLSFLQGAVKAGSLSEALGVHDPIIEQLGDDLQTELGRTVKETLHEMLEKIKDNVDNGKGVARELLEKVKEILKKLKDLGVEAGDKTEETVKKIRDEAKQILKKLLQRLGLGKRNLDDSLDQLARSKFRDVIEKIKEKLLSEETIQKIRDYIQRISGESELVQKLKDFVAKLRNTDLKELIKHLLEYRLGSRDARAIGDTWDKIKGFFKDLNVKIQEHSKKFGEWVKDMWNKGLDKLKEKHGTIKAIAMEFIAHGKDISAEVAREALEFFQPYKDDLGVLWKQIVDTAKEAIGRF